MTSPYLVAAAERAAQIKPNKATELNPSGIYAPPGDPLHRAEAPPPPIESDFLRLMVIYTIVALGLTGAICFALAALAGAL